MRVASSPPPRSDITVDEGAPGRLGSHHVGAAPSFLSWLVLVATLTACGGGGGEPGGATEPATEASPGGGEDAPGDVEASDDEGAGEQGGPRPGDAACDGCSGSEMPGHAGPEGGGGSAVVCVRAAGACPRSCCAP